MNGKYKPEYSEEYYFVYYEPYGEWHVSSNEWLNYMDDFNYYVTDNCFKTKEEASQNIKKIKNKLKQYIVEE